MSTAEPPSHSGLIKHYEQADIREMAVFRCEGKGNCPEWYEIEMADGAKMANVARRQRIASPKIMAAPASPVGGNWSSLYYKPTECMKDGLVMTLSTYHDEGKLDHQVVVALDAKASWDLYRRLCSLYRNVPATEKGTNV